MESGEKFFEPLPHLSFVFVVTLTPTTIIRKKKNEVGETLLLTKENFFSVGSTTKKKLPLILFRELFHL